MGVAALKNWIAQQAVGTILNQIHEVDFKGLTIRLRDRFCEGIFVPALIEDLTKMKY